MNLKMFNLKGKLVLITGGGGLLGEMYAEAILENGGGVVVADLNDKAAQRVVEKLKQKYADSKAWAIKMDVTDPESVRRAAELFPAVNVLINNAAKDPKVGGDGKISGFFETMSLEEWKDGIESILTGTFVCCQIFCDKFAKEGGGVVINISSDLGVIAPDQRIYKAGKKPITYSAAKFGVIGMTKYLATYFADKNIRVNSLSPGAVYVDQPKDFVDRLSQLIPLGRMARKDEYKGAIVFMCSNASSYMTGENIVMDGGRATW